MPGKNEPNGPEAKRKNDKQQPEDEQSFYEDIFDEADREDFHLAAGVDGIDDEIALLRGEIKKAVAGEDVANLREIVMATNALERLIRTKYQISKDSKKGLKDSVGTVLRDVLIPAGVTLGAQILGKRFG
jgi:hypothetical protein